MNTPTSSGRIRLGQLTLAALLMPTCAWAQPSNVAVTTLCDTAVYEAAHRAKTGDAMGDPRYANTRYFVNVTHGLELNTRYAQLAKASNTLVNMIVDVCQVYDPIDTAGWVRQVDLNRIKLYIDYTTTMASAIEGFREQAVISRQSNEAAKKPGLATETHTSVAFAVNKWLDAMARNWGDWSRASELYGASPTAYKLRAGNFDWNNPGQYRTPQRQKAFDDKNREAIATAALAAERQRIADAEQRASAQRAEEQRLAASQAAADALAKAQMDARAKREAMLQRAETNLSACLARGKYGQLGTELSTALQENKRLVMNPDVFAEYMPLLAQKELLRDRIAERILLMRRAEDGCKALRDLEVQAEGSAPTAAVEKAVLASATARYNERTAQWAACLNGQPSGTNVVQLAAEMRSMSNALGNGQLQSIPNAIATLHRDGATKAKAHAAGVAQCRSLLGRFENEL